MPQISSQSSREEVGKDNIGHKVLDYRDAENTKGNKEGLTLPEQSAKASSDGDIGSGSLSTNRNS